MKSIKKPSSGEIVNTGYGSGKVVKVIDYEDMKDDFNNEGERERFLCTVRHFLGNEQRYFELLVMYEDGEIDRFDWSEYKDNFAK